MERTLYIQDDTLLLCEYMDSEDDAECFACWQDPDTQRGYNHKSTETFEEFTHGETIQARFQATILRRTDQARIGSIFLSAENTPPDLAIMIYPPFRYKGYGSKAFALGMRYCFETLKLDRIFAGCYPHNLASLRMLLKSGFQPHPEGNIKELHYLTGEDITQLDFFAENPNNMNIQSQ